MGFSAPRSRRGLVGLVVAALLLTLLNCVTQLEDAASPSWQIAG